MELTVILEHGLIYSLLLSISLFLMVLVNPRLMLHGYPKEIRKSVIRQTKREKRQTITYGVVFLLTFLFYPFLLGLYYGLQYHLKFEDIMLFVWGVTMFFNLWDLIILDWLVVCTLTPKFIIIPGTAGNKGYKNYWFHFSGFLKGTVITLVLSMIITVLIKYVFMKP